MIGDVPCVVTVSGSLVQIVESMLVRLSMAVGRLKLYIQLTTCWCKVDGGEYCIAVLAGKRHREDANDVRNALLTSQMLTAIRSKARAE